MFRRSAIALLMLLAAPAVLAHGGGAHTHGAGLIAGLAHPFSGLDHLLAMVAVGLWAAQKGGRALWVLPTAFVSIMALGSGVGVMGYALPGIEVSITLSVLVLGLLIALQSRWSLQLACVTVGFFALVHGVAHGEEMPLAASPWGYGLGMMAATALLHGTGVLAGVKLRQIVVRAAGALISMAGIGMLFPLMG
jgi:urease accessory protein